MVDDEDAGVELDINGGGVVSSSEVGGDELLSCADELLGSIFMLDGDKHDDESVGFMDTRMEAASSS